MYVYYAFKFTVINAYQARNPPISPRFSYGYEARVECQVYLYVYIFDFFSRASVRVIFLLGIPNHN